MTAPRPRSPPLPLLVSAGSAERVPDPIYAAIEAQKATYAVALATVDGNAAFENEMQHNGRWKRADRLGRREATGRGNRRRS